MVADSIRVRMYAVGFGDCFLLGFPGPAGGRERLVLIDCGVHSVSQPAADLFTEVIPDIVAQASADGTPRIDVVVATHHHLDHVSGFRVEGWDQVEVGEVWLPWTEDPDDPVAQSIRQRQSKQAKLLLGLDLSLDKKWETVRAISENNEGFTNAAAMTTLHEGFAGSPRRWFLPQRDGKPRSRTFRPKLIPGLEVVILGPSRDESTIRDMNPPTGESFIRLDPDSGSRTLALGGEPLPFDSYFIEPRVFETTKEYADLVPKSASALGRIAKAGEIDALALAVALEKATNGTSLVLAFRFGDTTMLFTGDAQWGTWDRMLHDPESQAVLRSVNLYKVGHHGSHNATPVSFVKDYLSGADASLVSVAPTSISSWKDIPKADLMAELGHKSAIVLRADTLRKAARAGEPAPPDPAVIQEPSGLWTEIRLPVQRS
jgi:beta-lactamase superfamily II metal-dependent hydrolase